MPQRDAHSGLLLDDKLVVEARQSKRWGTPGVTVTLGDCAVGGP